MQVTREVGCSNEGIDGFGRIPGFDDGGDSGIPESLIEPLLERARCRPGDRALTFLHNGEGEGTSLSYGELDRSARRFASRLRELADPGERALLVTPPGLDYVVAFLGCLYAGIVAVPAYPPRSRRGLPRIRGIVRDSGATVAVASEQILERTRAAMEEETSVDARLHWVAAELAAEEGDERFEPSGIDSEPLAFLQYTSGSTGDPKGVMVSHGNLVRNEMAITAALGTSRESLTVSWLPPFHDMGLIGGILNPLFVGYPFVFMTPAAFLQRPIRWLETISRFRATVSGGPDFSFDLCTAKIAPEQMAGLDLSSWRTALNGAEPVRAATLRRFAERFGAVGFRMESFLPSYGLAEATLLATATPRERRPTVRRLSADALAAHRAEDGREADEGSVELVSSGVPGLGVRVAVVDPKTGTALPDGVVGEIWLGGPSIAKGYWRRPQATAETFGARIAGGGAETYLRTGDLGFLSGGELFVTGRLKELVIIDGRNIYPQDVEQVVEGCHPALRRHSGAAFSVEEDGAERLIVVQELRPRAEADPDEVLSTIRQAIGEGCELPVHAVALVEAGSVPKTTSGKIMRRGCRERYLSGDLSVVAEWRVSGVGSRAQSADEPAEESSSGPAGPTSAEIEAWLLSRLAETLGVSAGQLDPVRPFAYYGVGSADAVGLLGEVAEWLGREVDPETVFEHPTVRDLAGHLARAVVESGTGAGETPAPGPSRVGHSRTDRGEIAIIGMACRFPGADDPESLWTLLAAGDDGLRAAPEGHPARNGGDFMGGFLDPPSAVDCTGLGLSEEEAELVDPHHLRLLEVSRELVTRAGYRTDELRSRRVGVYVGMGTSDHARVTASAERAVDARLLTAAMGSMAANRISYAFDWSGPSMTLDTACSSSLVAVHTACEALRRGDVEMALVAGARLILDPATGRLYQEAGALSSSCCCRTFDDGADGFVCAEGVAAVLLKPLAAALEDGDDVWAVVAGTAVNHDGGYKVGLGAPNPRAQRDLLSRAYEGLSVAPEGVGLLEAHGSGTRVGDALEIRALSEVFAERTPKRSYCALGSIKSNLGHTEAASGMAGLIKAILALRHRQIPPTLHVETPNREIAFEETPFFVNDRLRPWPDSKGGRYAAVSAFGIGGTNAHVILEEAPCEAAAEEAPPEVPDAATLEAWLRGQVAAVTGRPEQEVGLEAAFLDLGIDSVRAMRLITLVEEALGERVSTLEVYEHPHIRSFAGYLEERFRAAGRALPTEPRRVPAAVQGACECHEPFPCTELQGAYLMARDLPAQLGGRGCRIYIEVDLPGADGVALEEGFNRLVRRHPMLRTVFPGDGTQRTLPEVPRYALRMEDLSALAPAVAEERCAALRDELSRTDLDPARWPLFDVRACRVDASTVRLFFSLDMLQVDFLSFLILMEEWRRLHDDPAAQLPALPMHFNQYVDALGELRHDRRYQEDREFWLERLERFPEAPPLPVRTETDELRRPDFASVGRVLSAETWARLQELASSHGVTPSAVLGTAYCRALTAWTGTGRFALNLPLFNRYPIAGCEEIDRPIGPFTTNVLLAVDLGPDGSFWDQARRFHTTTMEALEHRLFTGVELTRALLEHRRRGLAPVAPVVFTPALYRGKEDLWGEIRLALSQTAMVWLDCIAVQDGAGLRLFWDFVESLFERVDLETRFDRFVRELESLARTGEVVAAEQAVRVPSPAPSAAPSPVAGAGRANEAGSWADWPFIPREDWLRVREVNDTGAWYPRHPVHELIAEQTERDPGAPAILDGDREISYGELAERSNQVAQALVRRGVEPGSRVAVMMRRGAEPVVAILGALKAGAAYVPVDPGHPLERRLYTLRHCEPTVILSQGDLLEETPDLGDLPVLDLADPEIAGAPKDPVRVQVSMDSPAYLIYTSGSTGRPKGAVLTHGNAVNTCYDVGRRFGIGPGDRFMGFSSLAFDLSVFDLFGSLIHGAALVILPERSLREPAAWMDLLVGQGVTVWNSVPTGVKMLVDFWEGRGPDVPSLRLVMMSGDWIPVDLPDRIRGRFPNARVMALGGPTECTIWQNWYPVGDVDPAWTSIPYGKPLANHRFYVLDDDLRPVPLGEVGQMYLAGDGVGLGYWNDPEKTDAAFLVHPVLQERMYRSGDLGRYLPDMTLEILGRVDHQVKIRGFRIELGEIEAALRAHAAVDTAVVVAWKDRLGENRLAAFYTASAPVPGEELRDLVARSLPDYMVPSRLEQLSTLPLNDNAKIDRKTLARRAAEPADSAESAAPRTAPAPAPESPVQPKAEPRPEPQAEAASRVTGSGDGEELAGEVERILLSGWRELFGVADLDPEDNFFELGGNSQLAVRAIRSASEVLGVEIQVADLFSYPTIRKVSVALAERMPATGSTAGSAGSAGLGAGPVTDAPTPPASAEIDAPIEVAAPVEANEPGGGDAPTVGVSLPAPPLDAVRTAYAVRRSWRELDPEPLPRERLARWLESLRQLDLDGTPKYLWGSAGGLYPVQAYLQVRSRRVEGLDGGTYYVDPEIGALVRVADDEPGAAPHRAENRQLAEGAAFALYLVGELRAIRPLYGDRAHDLSFIEAGLMTQVLEQAAPEQRIGFCQVTGVEADRLSPALELGPDRLVLHMLLGGGLSEAQVTRAAADGAALREPSVTREAAPPLRSPAPSCAPTKEMAVNPYAGLRIPQGVEIYDPDERTAFKEGQAGVRRDLRDRQAIALGNGHVPTEVTGRYAVRRSWRRFSDEPVPAEAMGRFLARLRRLELAGRPKHRWASAGGSYPVAAYLHVHPGRVEGVDGGLYRYRSEDHRLVPLCADPSAVGVHLHFPHNREIFETCAFSVYLVGDLEVLTAAEPALDRPEERRELCLVEAGLIAQMLDGDVAAGGIGLCHVGDMRFDPIAETLGLGEHEVYLHSMLCGVPHPDERLRAETDREALTLPEAAKALASVAQRTGGADRAASRAGSGVPEPVVRRNGVDHQAIAVIGMAGRFPRAESLDRFWDLLRSGTDLITEIPPERWDVGRRFDPDPDRPGKTYARWGAFLDGIEEFDPLFFKLSPAEARVMDSQQRLLLELGWETLERAGYAGGKLSGTSTGVFVGASYSHHREMLGERPVDTYMGIGSHNALIANRLSYVFDLHGPSLTVDTLCSSSLVALHLACASMRRGECDSALVGAAQAEISPRYYEALSRLRALSPTGRCHTFDRSADGFVPGEGAGMVLLKPLQRALADGDPVLGVIRGTAVNHGGHSGGLTVPTPIAQAALIRTALDDAGVDADTIGYLEAHGTGTSLGDPIEVDGLTRAFREDTDRNQFCAIGSLKSNLGHLEPAAGVGGLIKVLLALRASELPPTLHVREPNPEILFERTPFYVVDRPRPWQPNGHPRRAGISGFGMGGANAHVIVEEAPWRAAPVRETERPLHLVTLSARSETALRELARRFADHFTSCPGTDLGDAAFTANTGRALFAHRLALSAADAGTAAERLAAFSRGESSAGIVAGHVTGRSRPRPVFLFAGQGAQKPGAGLELYRTQPVFRGALDRCAEILDGVLDRPLLDLLLDDDPAMAELLRETRYTQPTLFALEYALAELWRSWGVEPAAVVGHSLGEYVAACVAGVFSVEDGLRLVAERGRLMQELPEGGAMAALAASEAALRPVIEGTGGRAVLAAVNGPESTVVSGDADAVGAVVRSFEAQGVRATELRVSHAFHSPRMEPILDRFEAAAARFEPAAPRVPLVSNVLGRPFGPGEVPDAGYWRRHVREAVRFGPGLEALAAEGHDLFLELGPGATLTGMGRRALAGRGRFLVSLAGGSGDWGALLRSLGTLHTLGSPVNWDGFDAPYGRRRVPLPTTPFERTRCWVDPAPGEPVEKPAPTEHPLLGRRLPAGPGDGAEGAADPAGPAGVTRFERRFEPAAEPVVAQHRVRGVPVLPGVGQIEMMVAAARQVLGDGALAVQDLAFTTPFAFLGSEPRIARVEVEERQGAVACRVVSWPESDAAGAEPPVEHSRARVVPRTEPAPPPRGLPEAGSALSPEEIYRRAEEMGLGYGAIFRSIHELRTGDGLAVARLDGPSAGPGYLLEPGLLDGAFQALGTLLAVEAEAAHGDGRGLYVPFAVGELVIHGPLRGPVDAVAVRSGERGEHGTGGRGDIALLDLDGRVLVEVTGLSVRRMADGSGRLVEKGREDVSPGWLLRRVWRPVEADAMALRELEPGTWLLAGKGDGLAEALARRLAARGLRCLTAVAGDTYGRRADGVVTLRPNDREDWQRLIEELEAEVPPLRGIVHLWGAGAPTSEPGSVEELRERIGTGVESLAALTRAAAGSATKRELWVVTRGAEAVGAGGGPSDLPPVPERAAALALARVVRQEVPRLTCRSLDLPPTGTDPGALAAVVEDTLRSESPVPEAAWRPGGLLTPDLEPWEDGAAAVAELPERAVVWITGGLGDLGLELAREMVRVRPGAAAPRLLLQGRTPLPPREEWAERIAAGDGTLSRRLVTIQELEAAGAEVWVVAAEVSDVEAMGELAEEIVTRWGTPFAIVHAAGIVRDGLLRTKELETFRDVLRPKVEGGWILERIARRLDVERLVLFSSVVAVAGNPGQGDYAAANAYLDALALGRLAEGRSAVSLGWGPWDEVGMAARAGIDVRALGIEPIPLSVGRRLALQALAGGEGHRVVLKRVGPAARTERPPARPAAGTRPAGRGSEADLGRRLEDHLAAELGAVLGMAPEEIDRETNFMELGFDSLMAVKLQSSLADASGVRLEPTLLFEHPSIRELARALAAEHMEEFERMLGGVEADAPATVPGPVAGPAVITVPAATASSDVASDNRGDGSSRESADRTGREIAVVGLACRFPGATTPEAFWELIRGGVDAIREIPPERWDWRESFDATGRRPGTTRSRWGGFLDRVDGFDPGFFGLSPREAKFMDPQQRLFLEVVWEALERAGYRPAQLAQGKTGVFVGIAASDYGRVAREGGAGLDPHMGSGSVLSMVPNRVSYLFDWKGPSMAVDTACSSSLVALDLACRSLRDGEADMAVVGGSNLILTPDATVVFSQAGMLSGRGRCMTFDDRADGYVRGEGVAAVLLEPLDRALERGDDVWAVIRDVVVNHDGHSKASLTAPNPKAQRELLLEAFRRAKVSPDSLGLLEAHGTGTAMGDPIEIRGLTEAFRRHTDRNGFCAIGSAKSNVGHLEPAAGMAGLVKAILALRHRELPPTLHIETPNRKISFEETPFYVADRLRPWPAAGTPRRAGVSSFGFGGVNAHAVLEEAPSPSARPGHDGAERPVHLFKLSARSAEALRRLVEAHAEHLDRHPDEALADLCSTSTVGRSDFEHRAAFVVARCEELRERLVRLAAGESAGGSERQDLYGMLRDLSPAGAAALRGWCSGDLWSDSLEPVLTREGAYGPAAADGALLKSEHWLPVLEALAALYVRGITVDWEAVERGTRRRKVALPTYPFERRSCWVGDLVPVAVDGAGEDGSPQAGEPEPAEAAGPAEPAGMTERPGPEGVAAQTAAPGAPSRDELEAFLRERVADALELGAEAVAVDADLMTMGLESVSMMELVAAIRESFGFTLYPAEVLQRPSIRELAEYLAEELRALSADAADAADAADVSEAAQAAPAAAGHAPSSPIFLLSSPRSGSTLLRVMLAGHPGLFCPPELHLLGYETLGERARGLGASYLGEGLQRALMELDGLDAEAGARRVAELTGQDLPVADVYGLLRESAGGRLLVDKSPSYASDLETVLRAEELFERPLYLGLVRHPNAVVESFARKRMHRLLGIDGDPYDVAEEIWRRSYRNLLELRSRLGNERVHMLRYEDLVRDPEPVLREVCAFLGVPFDASLLTPYEGERMTDGVHPESMAIGDPDFHRHQGIDASLADAWKRVRLPRPLSEDTRRLVAELGYPEPDGAAAEPGPRRGAEVLVPLRREGRRPPLFCFHPAGGQVLAYRSLAERLGADQPVWALQSRALDGVSEERPTLAAMAAEYAETIREVQPAGEPYRLLGWSMGGHLALAVAAELESAGADVAFLSLWDSRRSRPSADDPDADQDGGSLRAIASAFGGAIGAAVARLDPPVREALLAELSACDPEDRIRRAIEWARSEGVLSSQVPTEALVEQMALVETHVKRIRGHEHRVVRAPIHVWWAQDDLSRRPTTDWSRWTTAAVHTSVVPGDHFTMVQGEGLERLASELSELLGRLGVEGLASATAGGRIA